MNKLTCLSSVVILITVSGVNVAYADPHLTLGVGADILQSPYKQYSRDIYPVPLINWENDDYWFRGLGGGYYLWNDRTDKLSVIACYSPVHFTPDDSNNRQLQRLNKRKGTLMAGLSWRHLFGPGFVRTSITRDILNNSNGTILDAAWLYPYTTGLFTLTPGAGIEWDNRNANDYYYGISHKESARSGLKSYQASSSWSPYLEVTLNYRFAANWSFYGSGRYVRLSNEVKDSPMVDKNWSGQFLTGFTYTF
ncbi:MipA/OmpV family protein [Salmonella enterica]|uniref:MipA/OmpV family protein n=1 Tax=Citrobacter koseri TaxID=545 RepID=UPI001903A22D|nr:MipA/OmpV family protein [Salmonella enterica]MBJ9356255.1 MipA/OmpV family protein [Citrobacter koseri]